MVHRRVNVMSEVVDPPFVTWNQIAGWLRLIDRVRGPQSETDYRIG